MGYARRALRSVTYYWPAKAFNGFTLFTPMVPVPSSTWLIDMEGRFVHRWELPGWIRLRAHLLPDGNLLFGLADPESPESSGLPFAGGKLMEMDWDGNVVWQYDEPLADLHDWIRLPNGNTIFLKYTELPRTFAAALKGGRPGTERSGGAIMTYVMQEITREGKVVWEWLPYEHMDPELDNIDPLAMRETWPGWNSLVGLPDGNILCCSYNTSNLVIIDKASGEIKWRWGHGILSMPHNPSLLANGNILVLDNQRFPTKFRPPHGSRLVEVNPTTNEIEWEYSDENPVDFWTCYIGGCERLPNGNTLVCEGAMGRFFEITPEKQLVWEYVVPFYARREGTVYGLSNCTFRCHRYGPDYPGLKGKRLNPAQYDTWNQLYGPGAVASPLRIDSQHPAAEALPVLGQSLGQPKQVDKAAERLKMLGY